MPIIRNQAPKERQLAFIGSANWDIYLGFDGNLWAVPKPEHPDCHETYFGNRDHIKKLMANGWFDDEPTEVGLALMEGLQSRLLPNGHFLSFH